MAVSYKHAYLHVGKRSFQPLLLFVVVVVVVVVVFLLVLHNIMPLTKKTKAEVRHVIESLC